MENDLLNEAAALVLKAAYLIQQAVEEADPDDSELTIEWLTEQMKSMREFADSISPPKHAWPGDNIVTFVPRRTG